MRNLPISSDFEGPTRRSPLNAPEIDEASGIVRSVSFPGYLWTHNDSGDEARLFLISETGSRLATYQVTGAENRDWEDIAIGPGPTPGTTYLYIGEIGDNRANHTSVRIYRVPEPQNIGNSTANSDIIEFRYPDGAIDAETLLSDPLTGDLYMLSKRVTPTRVFRLTYPQSTGTTIIAEHIGNLPFTGAVGGDISSDGTHIIIKTLEEVYLWTRSTNESITAAFLRPPQRLPYEAEPQGEAIAWSADGNHYYTLSERLSNPVDLNRYSRKSP